MITNLGTGTSFRVNDQTGDADSSPFLIDASGNVTIGSTTTTGLLNVGSSAQFQISATGVITAPTTLNTINGLIVNAGALSGVTGLSQGSGAFTVNGSGAVQLGTGTNTVQIGNSTGTIQLDSNTVDISTIGVISGAIGVSSSGTITFSALNSAGLVTNTSGGVLGTTSTIGTSFITDNSLDFVDFENTLDLDAALILNQGANTWIQNFTATTGTGYTLNADSVTSGTASEISVDTLQSGKGLLVSSTSTGLTTGNLAQFNWSPGLSTTATGDLFNINIGALGTADNLFNVTDAGVSLFKITEGTVISAVAATFSSASGTSFSANLLMTNQTASSIITNGPLTIDVGDTNESNNLILKSYNTGIIGLQADAVQIGSGGAGSSDPTLLFLDIKSDAGDPSVANGSMYYNSNIGKFRCVEGGAWDNCITSDTPSLRNTWFIFEDWQQNTITAGTTSDLGNIGDNLWTFLATSGTLSKIDVAAAAEDRGRIGVLGINITAVNNAGAHLRLDNTSIAGVPANLTLEFDFASTTTNIQTNARIGLHDSTTNASPVDGLYFQYNVTTVAGNWFYCARNNSTETCTNSGVVKAAVNTYQKFKIATSTGGTQIDYYIDDVLVGSITSASGSFPVATRSYGPTVNVYTNNNIAKNFKMDYF